VKQGGDWSEFGEETIKLADHLPLRRKLIRCPNSIPIQREVRIDHLLANVEALTHTPTKTQRGFEGCNALFFGCHFI
jgi:hypothetical protein